MNMFFLPSIEKYLSKADGAEADGAEAVRWLLFFCIIDEKNKDFRISHSAKTIFRFG